MGWWLSCFEPRKKALPEIARSAKARPQGGSREGKRPQYQDERTADGLRKWQEARRLRTSEEQQAQHLESQAYTLTYNQAMQRSGIELSPGQYDYGTQRQQREPTSRSVRRPDSGVDHYAPYYENDINQQEWKPANGSKSRPMSGVDHYPHHYDTQRRQKKMSGVDHYPGFDEILDHERQAPRANIEHFEHGKDDRNRRPFSGTDHYAAMLIIDEHENSNPQALDSRYATAFDALVGKADIKAERSCSQRNKPDGIADVWASDGGLARPVNSGSPTRSGGPRREIGRPRQKEPAAKSSQQTSGRKLV